jgi:hypothetical protein
MRKHFPSAGNALAAKIFPHAERTWAVVKQGGSIQLLYDAVMKLKTIIGSVVDVAEADILAAAGVIYAHRRRTHGHPPLRVFHCRWCRAEIRGRGPLEQHEQACEKRPSGDPVAVSDEDMLLLRWAGPGTLP